MSLVSQGRNYQPGGCRPGILLLAGDEAAVAYCEGFETATLDVVGTTLFGCILNVPGHHLLPDVVIGILLFYIREAGYSLARDEIGAIGELDIDESCNPMTEGGGDFPDIVSSSKGEGE
jgi:hypothetical protein